MCDSAPKSSGCDQDAPIGVFDSGFGGLTVLRSLIALLPHERFVFFGDSARCPYGPRQQSEVRGFTLQICDYLRRRGCKMIVIACNTATAAGLEAARASLDIPITGVVEPGARAAVARTRCGRIGVIATQGTTDSKVYEKAIRAFSPDAQIFSCATPEFVKIAEAGIDLDDDARRRLFMPYGEKYLGPLKCSRIDTLVLGCTHFPLLGNFIAEFMGKGVSLVSSADETALDVRRLVHENSTDRANTEDDLGEDLACGQPASIEFLTTSPDIDSFARFGSAVLGCQVDDVSYVKL